MKGFVYKHKLMSFDFIVMALVVHTCVKYTKLKIVHELFDRMTENELKFIGKLYPELNFLANQTDIRFGN